MCEGPDQNTRANSNNRLRNLPLNRLGAGLRETLRVLWPAYVLTTLLILSGFRWGLVGASTQPVSFNADENAAVWAIQQMHAPFFYPPWLAWGTAFFYQVYLAKVLLSLVRQTDMGNIGVLLVARSLVLLSALGAVTAMFLLGCKLFDRWTGRLAATLLGVSPAFVLYGHYFKTDIPMIFWLLVAVVLAFRVMESRALRYVVPLGLAVGYAASTKYYAAVLAPCGLAAIVASVAPAAKIRAVLSYSCAILAGFLFGTPYAILHPRAWFSALALDARLNSTRNINLVAGLPVWLDYPLRIFPLALTFPVMILAAVGFGWAFWRRRKALLPIWILLLCYFALLASDQLRMVRYAIPLVPFAVLFVAGFLSELRGIRRLRGVTAVGSCVLVTYVFLFSLSYVQAMAKLDPRLQATRWTEAHIQPGSTVFTSRTHYLDSPQLDQLGYRLIDVGENVAELQHRDARYFILTELTVVVYEHSLWHAPQRAAFLSYVTNTYTPLACFENPQTLSWIHSKPTSTVPLDWLQPNPRICILLRNGTY